jgi:hypothetical protein
MRAARAASGTPVPKTPWGQADLSGLWDKRPYGGTNMAAGIQPLPFTPEGLKAYNDVWNHVDPTSRCVLPGVPRVTNSPYPMQIIHLQDKVIMLYEYMHNHRLIYTDGRSHPKEYLPQLMGHSIGRWEGDTLVIETTNNNAITWLDNNGDRHSDAMTIVERFTPINNNAWQWEATFNDPVAYTTTWKIAAPMTRGNNPEAEILEFACVEGNTDHLHYTEDVGGTTQAVPLEVPEEFRAPPAAGRGGGGGRGGQ